MKSSSNWLLRARLLRLLKGVTSLLSKLLRRVSRCLTLSLVQPRARLVQATQQHRRQRPAAQPYQAGINPCPVKSTLPLMMVQATSTKTFLTTSHLIRWRRVLQRNSKERRSRTLPVRATANTTLALHLRLRMPQLATARTTLAELVTLSPTWLHL